MAPSACCLPSLALPVCGLVPHDLRAPLSPCDCKPCASSSDFCSVRVSRALRPEAHHAAPRASAPLLFQPSAPKFRQWNFHFHSFHSRHTAVLQRRRLSFFSCFSKLVAVVTSNALPPPLCPELAVLVTCLVKDAVTSSVSLMPSRPVSCNCTTYLSSSYLPDNLFSVARDRWLRVGHLKTVALKHVHCSPAF